MDSQDFEQIKRYLTQFLEVKVEFKDGGNAYWSGDHELKVTLTLEDKTISESTTYLPNHNVASEYSQR